MYRFLNELKIDFEKNFAGFCNYFLLELLFLYNTVLSRSFKNLYTLYTRLVLLFTAMNLSLKNPDAENIYILSVLSNVSIY